MRILLSFVFFLYLLSAAPDISVSKAFDSKAYDKKSENNIHNTLHRKKDDNLAELILQDERLNIIREKGLAILSTGFNAGSGYQEVWIRDLNTFISYSLEVRPQQEVRNILLRFLNFQGFDGNIIDGYQQVSDDEPIDYYGRYSRYDMPGYAFHKNTVETDQETSLVQTFHKYIEATGDLSILHEQINGRTVMDRLAFALDFLLKHRFNLDYGLIWGAFTVDWGDVQPGHPWGVKYDEYSIPVIDVYDNAMFLIALENIMDLQKKLDLDNSKWENIYEEIRNNVRTHLWDEQNQKFIPHVYIQEGTHTLAKYEEDMFYHGGTAVAIQAGLLDEAEIRISLERMQQNVREAGAQSIGLTLYPVYPENTFMNPGMAPWSYQNGGDWTWFGARMITALVHNGFVEEAYEALAPMLDRVIANDGFYEWYTKEGHPKGSGEFRGSAGVLIEAIDALHRWAEE